MKFLWFFLFMSLTACVQSNDLLVRQTSDKQIGRIITISNKFLSTAIYPDKGGCIGSLIYRGKELTNGDGIAMDHFWGEKLHGDFYQAPYSYEIKKGADYITVAMRRQGVRDINKFIEIFKEITLRKNSAVIAVKCRYLNRKNSRITLNIKPWFHQIAGAPEDACYFIPTTTGIIDFKFRRGMKIQQRWFNAPARGWTGVIGNKSGTGLVCFMDYKHLNCFYNFMGGNIATMEWRFSPIKIECGQSFSTAYTVFPFHGIKMIDGAGNGIVGEIEPNRISIIADAPREVSIEIFNDGQKVLTETAKLSPEKIYHCNFKTAGQGNITCNIKAPSGKLLADLCVNQIPTRRHTYNLQPLEARLISKQARHNWNYQISDVVKTPFIKQGKHPDLKVFFLTDSSALRDLIELQQRYDIATQYTTLPAKGVTCWISPDKMTTGPQQMPQAVMEKHLKTLPAELCAAKPRVIVIGDYYNYKNRSDSFGWKNLGKNVQAMILNLVKQGTGLVIVNPSDVSGDLKNIYETAQKVSRSDYLLRDRALPKYLQCRIGKCGSGQIVFLEYKGHGLLPILPVRKINSTALEPLFSVVMKAILTAAERIPDVRIRKITKLDNHLRVTLNKASAGTASGCLWTGDADIKYKFAKTIKSGTTNFSITFPESLPAGNYMLTLRFDRDWLNTPVKIAREYEITGIKLDREYYHDNQPVTGKILFNKNLPTGAAVKFSVYDNYNRVIFERQLQATGKNEMTLSLPVPASLTVMNRMEASVLISGRNSSYREELLWKPDAVSKKPLFTLNSWGGESMIPRQYAKYTYQLLKQHKFTSVNVGTMWQVEDLAYLRPQTNLRTAMNKINRIVLRHRDMEKINKAKDKSRIVRNPCLSDPDYWKSATAKIRSNTAKTRKYGADNYMLGDEMCLTTEGGNVPVDVCFGPHCMKAFRLSLKQQFSSLSELNSDWKTSFQSWDNVIPDTLNQAIKSGNYSSWMAHRRFMDTVYADHFRRSAKAIRKLHPGAYVGESGIQDKVSAYGGYDWAKRMPYENTVNWYGTADLPMSFIKDRRQGMYGSWALGYYRNEATDQYRMWRALFHGHNQLSYFYSPILVNPDLTESVYCRLIAPYLDEFMSGPAQTIAEADYVYSPIAILMSQNSLLISFLKKQTSPIDTYQAYKDNLTWWNNLLRDNGYCPRFITPEQIGDNVLDNYRALILPLTYSMDKKVAEKISRFVNKGGVIIADAQTGIFNQFGKANRIGTLDNLFKLIRRNSKLRQVGIKHSCGDTVFQMNMPENGITSNGNLVSQTSSGRVYGSITLSDKSVAGQSGISTGSFGSGKFMYLAGIRVDFPEKSLNSIINFLEKNQINPLLKVMDKGHPVRIDCGAFKSGAIKYYGVIVQPSQLQSMTELKKQKMAVELTFLYSGLLYELRSHRFIGKVTAGASVKDSVCPGIAVLYAILPQAPQITCKVDNKKIELKTNLNAGYPVKLDVLDGTGKSIEPLSSVMMIPAQGLTWHIPLQLNPPDRHHRLIITDIIAGKTINQKLD